MRNKFIDFTGAPWLIESYPQEYNRDECNVIMPVVAEPETILSGHPMAGCAFCTAENIALCDGLLLDAICNYSGEAEPGTVLRVAVLRRGHNVILLDRLPKKDYLGTAINTTEWALALTSIGLKVTESSNADARCISL